MTVRRFRWSDLPGVVALESVCFPSEPWPESMIRSYAQQWLRGFLVAVDNSAGVVGWSVVRTSTRGAKLDSIAVHPDFRGRGLGTRLLRASIRLARPTGGLSLMVRPDNMSAIRLYEAHGFVRTRTVPDYYEDGSPAVRLRLSL